MRRLGRALGCRQVMGALAGCLVIGVVARAEAAPIFSAADAATVVVRAKVEGSTPYPKAKLQVFHLRVTRSLKGPVAAGERLELAQEMLFASTKTLFADGAETLVLAVPLPSYSSFQEVLPSGTYWRWAERLETTADVAPLTDPALTDAVAAYLAAEGDAERVADFVVAAIVGANARVRDDALQEVRTRREIAPLLDTGRLQPVAAWLDDARQPALPRAAAIVQLARAKAPGATPIAERLASAAGPLQAPAIDALLTLGRPPAVERLVSLSRSPDEPLRLVASRGLATAASEPALDRLAELLPTEPSPPIRVAVMQAFGVTPNPRVVALAAAELTRSDKNTAVVSAEALARQGTDDAIAELRKALEGGREDARFAAAFGLKHVNRREADAILEEVEQSHPDPQVRRVCKLARGESLHDHEH